ncbi:ABC transporter substrate-binding protein [Enterococcus gallinarum]|uniref:ABC transporter substrate-binding protein n=1 Tax=Enterococcus gallinarum TaxID=1353 RepID=A0AAE7SZH1_ENTGA|nr:ABC transporter substrate-binding protein [Enterococcus gallinarum]MBM6742083.1 ABC transporter substrate-binding protein [Enterococcus gallinarum]QOG26929.1 ABC transporter substrate-binding protein [Enterococcus gallinarum]RBT38941.1 ABC transporter substrate-binding protein [Enterococcus gallinarum]ROY68927.1 ABC transporter substrate-binding protein [Enterococcus gallinarum]ROZ02766.1 ABC transporter substrate-binding protein [Enterococcus gallinarum]
MKMKKWITTGLLATTLGLGLAACGNTNNATEDGKKTVGILQLVEHGSLDAAYEGFKEGLAEGGYKEGENLTLEYQNAQNSQDNLKSMSEKLVKNSPDLLLGIATPAAVSLANETTDIPIVVTAVTDLVEAKLADSNEAPGRNITGTSDMVPIDKQIQLLLSIVPDAKTIGIMYNAGEANSKIQADLAEKALKDAGVDVKVLTANTTNDVQQVTTSLAKDVDGIYVPTDNTFASAAAVVGEVAKETKTPIVAGSVEQVEDGALATFGIDYKSLGKQTGELAAKILDGDEMPATTPVETANKLELVVNQEMATALGIDPESIVAPE